jgi:hypothetical protein
MTNAPARDELEQALHRLTDQALDSTQRVGHLLLVLAAAAIAFALGGMLVERLPISRNATLGIAAMFALTTVWLVYGVRVLMRRRTLLVDGQVAAARLALLFTATVTAGAMAFGALVGARAMTGASWFGVLMMSMAVIMYVRAWRRRAALQSLRARLEQT